MAEEEQRFQAYSEYLQKKEAEIKEKTSRNLEEMIRQYPDGGRCTTFGTDSGRLWNRNDTQSDFLFSVWEPENATSRWISGFPENGLP